MGLLKFIENNLPYSWEVASKKFRCKGDLCKRIYDNVPSYYKGNKMRDKEVRLRAYKYIRNIFKHDLINAINIANSDYKYWVKVNDFAKNQEEAWR